MKNSVIIAVEGETKMFTDMFIRRREAAIIPGDKQYDEIEITSENIDRIINKMIDSCVQNVDLHIISNVIHDRATRMIIRLEEAGLNIRYSGNYSTYIDVLAGLISVSDLIKANKRFYNNNGRFYELYIYTGN